MIELKVKWRHKKKGDRLELGQELEAKLIDIGKAKRVNETVSMSNTKDEILRYLEGEGLEIDTTLTKKELLEYVEK